MQASHYSLSKKIGLISGPLVFITFLLLPSLFGLNPEAQKVIALAVWMLIWWISEGVSLAVTALLPMIFLPLLGITATKEAAAPYSSPIVYLFMGGFIIALAMEKWKLHIRIALSIVKLTGTNANGIVLGFMLATALLSMWISNTATTVMMLPIATSVIVLLKDKLGEGRGSRNFALSMMLGIAYAANVGGVATLIGTPPNVVFRGFMESAYNIEIDFLDWLIVGIPFSAILITITYLFIVKIMHPSRLGEIQGAKELIDARLKELGKISKQEKIVLTIFLFTAFLWITRKYINDFLPIQLDDTIIAMFGALSLFVVPTNWEKGEFILSWKDTSKLPWGILLLFGGGLSLAGALSKTGIIDLIGQSVASANTLPLWIIVILLISIMLFMTEIMSNVALVTVFLPVVGGIATGLDLSVLLVAIPVTMASSCAFMLPMSTPPNAIVFASGHIKVPQMVRVGVFLNIASILLLGLFTQTVIKWVFL